MKSLNKLFVFIGIFLLASCNTGTTSKSYELAEAGKHYTTLNFIASAEELREATIDALTLRKWSLSRQGDAIVAKINHRGVDGRLYITFATDTIHINSKGSNIDNVPIVPIRLIDSLNKTIRKQLYKNKQRKNSTNTN